MPDTFDTLAASFRRDLRVRTADRTVGAYMESVTRFVAWARSVGLTGPEQVTRDHIRTWLEVELARVSAQTTVRHYSGVRQWFKWLLVEEEIETNPTDGITQPKVPERVTAIPSSDVLRLLLKTCPGNDFYNVRDKALIMLLADGGPRAAEVIGLHVKDVDLDDHVVLVLGKGSRPRGVPIGRKAVKALDKYIRTRAKREDADRPEMWLGLAGPLTTSGLRQILRRRCAQAGISPALHPHQMRHYFSDAWLREGGSESDLMRVNGWKSRQMVDRYGAALAASRAREAHKRLSPGDRL